MGIDSLGETRETEGGMMKSFKELATSTENKSLKAVYGIIAEKDGNSYTGDSADKRITLSSADADGIKDLLYEEVKARYAADGMTFQSLEEAKKSVVMKLNDYVKDGFYNPMNGTGSRADPGMWNSVNVPVSLSPNEATSYYTSGGLGRIIIDKKAAGALLNGYHFDAEFMTEKDKEVLKEYAQSIGFDECVVQGCREALIYGGEMVYPIFKKDTSDSYSMPLNKLVDDKIIEKDCIDRFVHADRWNCVIVPDYNLTARDYVYPSTFFVPIGGVRVATCRAAMTKPSKLPYWGVIRQIGWGVSDFESYIRSILAYRVMMATVPIMAQQMSLLVHEIPLDGIIAQNGIEGPVEDFVKENNQMLRKWSMFDPMTVNSYGKLTAINRSFTDFYELILSTRQDIGAEAGLAESVLFHTQPTGFSDNKEDITLKQSETIKGINKEMMPAFKPIIKIMIASCFGVDSEYFQKADRVRMSFESPEVVTNEERGKLLEKFANAVASLNGAGMALKTAVETSQKFLPDIQIPQTIIDSLEDKPPKEKSKDSFPPFLAKNGSAPEKQPDEGEIDAETS